MTTWQEVEKEIEKQSTDFITNFKLPSKCYVGKKEAKLLKNREGENREGEQMFLKGSSTTTMSGVIEIIETDEESEIRVV